MLCGSSGGVGGSSTRDGALQGDSSAGGQLFGAFRGGLRGHDRQCRALHSRLLFAHLSRPGEVN